MRTLAERRDGLGAVHYAAPRDSADASPRGRSAVASIGTPVSAAAADPLVQRPARRPYLRISRVSKCFGAFQALSDVSLEIDEGELVCFLGPSGCGKTTLLRAIAGLTPESSGRIMQAGHDLTGLPPSRRDFGIVFQSYALFPNLTVAANVGYGLVSRRMKRAGIEARVAELLDLVGLPTSGSKYPSQLSGGQQQRVALARALATSPGLLLLDEPLSALDARVRVRLRHEIRELQQRLGLTTILVTHDQEEALAMADRIVVMNHGVIEQVGTPLEVYRSPATPFVADFVGRMNSVPAVLERSLEGCRRARVGDLVFDLADVPMAFPAVAPGLPVLLCVRPEDVELGALGNAPVVNGFEVEIATLDFQGAFYRATVVAPALGRRELTLDVSVQRARELAVCEGLKLRATIPSERFRVFARPLTPG